MNKTLALNANFPLARFNLGLVLRDGGRFAEALTAFRRFQKLAAQDPQWKGRPATLVSEMEKLIDLEAKLPAPERDEWRRLWTEMAKLLKGSQDKE